MQSHLHFKYLLVDKLVSNIRGKKKKKETKEIFATKNLILVNGPQATNLFLVVEPLFVAVSA